MRLPFRRKRLPRSTRAVQWYSTKAVLRLAFAGPANASVWNWWPLPVWVITGLISAGGLAKPKVAFSRAAWVAIFLGVVALLLFRAAYKLHAASLRPFPNVKIVSSLTQSWPNDEYVQVMVGLQIWNRENERRVSLEPQLNVELSRYPGQSVRIASVSPQKPINLGPERNTQRDIEYRWDHKDDDVLTSLPHHPPKLNLPKSPSNIHDKLRLTVIDHLSDRTVNFPAGGQYDPSDDGS